MQATLKKGVWTNQLLRFLISPFSHFVALFWWANCVWLCGGLCVRIFMQIFIACAHPTMIATTIFFSDFYGDLLFVFFACIRCVVIKNSCFHDRINRTNEKKTNQFLCEVKIKGRSVSQIFVNCSPKVKLFIKGREKNWTFFIQSREIIWINLIRFGFVLRYNWMDFYQYYLAINNKNIFSVLHKANRQWFQGKKQPSRNE